MRIIIGSKSNNSDAKQHHCVILDFSKLNAFKKSQIFEIRIQQYYTILFIRYLHYLKLFMFLILGYKHKIRVISMYRVISTWIFHPKFIIPLWHSFNIISELGSWNSQSYQHFFHISNDFQSQIPCGPDSSVKSIQFSWMSFFDLIFCVFHCFFLIFRHLWRFDIHDFGWYTYGHEYFLNFLILTLSKLFFASILSQFLLFFIGIASSKKS